jgi:hypothetical protein
MFSRIAAHSVKRVVAGSSSLHHQQQQLVTTFLMASSTSHFFSTAAELFPGVGFGKTSTGIVSLLGDQEKQYVGMMNVFVVVQYFLIIEIFPYLVSRFLL